MTCYAESSAVLAWLLDEASGSRVAEVLASADTIVTSDLTLVEVDRGLLRLTARGALERARSEALRHEFAEAVREWAVVPLAGPVVDRARAPMPDDAVRALDAIHLASAITLAAAVADLEVLSLDDRVRTNAAALGLRVQPA